MPTRMLVLVLGTTLMLGSAVLAQQHSYTQADVDAGAKLYETACGSCHGENGDKVVGIDFTRGTFKTARTDDDMIRIIRTGIPNAGMPPHPYSEVQANTIVAFVRSMLGGRANNNASAIASLTGDPARGKTIFEGKGNCASCHAINGAGGTSGPDLGAPTGGRGGGGRGAAATGVPPVPGAAAGAPPAAGAGGGRGGRGGAGGARGGGQAGAPRGGGGAPPAGGGAPPAAAGGGGRGGPGAAAPNPQQLERSIVDPNAEMAPQYRVYQVVTKNNVTARGTLLNQDTFSVQMRDNTEKLMSYWKQDLKEYGFLPSPMPSYKGVLTPQEIADVVNYLITARSNP